MLLLLPVLFSVVLSTPSTSSTVFSPDTVETFETGSVVLTSFPGQDMHPDSWQLDTLITHDSSRYSLRLFGNTWKLEPIVPRALDSGTVWQVAAYVSSLGEIQGFGLASSTDTLFYSFAGSEECDPGEWVTVYQGAFPTSAWNRYPLPVGEDWLARFGHLDTVTAIVFVNDRDTDPRAIVYFDDVLDITADLPIAPKVRVWHTQEEPQDNGDGTWDVTVHFFSEVIDPDSPDHEYRWTFGDDSTSTDSCPTHTYLVTDDHVYTVLLEVSDSTGRIGRAACRVQIDAGPTSFPLKLNFAGDMMLARRYELTGGIIDTMGPEAVFDSILPWLGEAADLTIANLECPFTSRGTRHPTKSIAFRGRPSNLDGIAYAGIDVVSLANNHTIDYGLVGLEDTRDSLAARGILFCGAGANSYEAYQPVFVCKSGVNLAFLAYSDRTGQYDNYQPYLNAGYSKPGFADQDTYRIFDNLRRVDSLADYSIIELHAGEEYDPTPDADDEFYSARALGPSDTIVELRHRIIDAGTDLIIAHHPHILQGIEVYRGKVIAHSLGNFCFDQEYPETYPTVILNAEIDRHGLSLFSLVPVYIDDYIPRHARGELGRHILDYLARRSRELGTWVITNPDSVTALVCLDTLSLSPVIHRYTDSLSFAQDGTYWVSRPLSLRRQGSISKLVSASPSRTWQYRLGRDLVWNGNMEDEGSTLWWLNQSGERYDANARRGLRSLRQYRATGTDSITTTLEERIPCYSDSAGHTICGWLSTTNAKDAGITVGCYDERTASTPLGRANLDTLVSGNTSWRFYSNDFVPEPGTMYFDVWMRSEGPDSGAAGYAWFDDVSLIEWEPWQSFSGPAGVVIPNDFYWVQLRATASTQSGTLTYEETGYEPQVPVLEPRTLPLVHRFFAAPNPARRLVNIAFTLARPSRATISITDVSGRLVRVLAVGGQRSAVGSVLWDRLDATGRLAPAGIYFLRLCTADTNLSTKLVVVD